MNRRGLQIFVMEKVNIGLIKIGNFLRLQLKVIKWMNVKDQFKQRQCDHPLRTLYKNFVLNS